MKFIINIIAFWMLMIYAISLGDIFAIILTLAGFLIMMTFIEDLEESDYNSNIMTYSNKEVDEPKKRTRRSKKEQKSNA